MDAFRYRTGLDLTGYEDGTENPKGDDAAEAAVVSGHGPGLDGSSFVAVQQWVHDLDRFESFSSQTQDHIIGRRKSDNVELKDGPDAAHVKRTEQEAPEQEAPDRPAFLLRRSMPWADAQRAGLVFVAFGSTLDAFEYHLARMVGASGPDRGSPLPVHEAGDRRVLLVSPDPRWARRPEPARLIRPADAPGSGTAVRPERFPC